MGETHMSEGWRKHVKKKKGGGKQQDGSKTFDIYKVVIEPFKIHVAQQNISIKKYAS